MQSVLVTGAAGFIGFYVARRELADGGAVVALNNLNSSYDPELKKARLAELAAYPNFQFQQRDIADRAAMAELFAARRFDCVIHLAAQAGVRYSLVDPHAYADANVVGFLNILEGCRHTGCKHLIYASPSSVYGANSRMPLRTSDNTDQSAEPLWRDQEGQRVNGAGLCPRPTISAILDVLARTSLWTGRP